MKKLRKNSDLWYKISNLLNNKNKTYKDISQELDVSTDQVKYVLRIENKHRNVKNFIFKDKKLEILVNDILLNCEKDKLSYKETSNKLNSKLNDYLLGKKITPIMVLKWRKKFGYPKRNSSSNFNKEIYINILGLLKSRNYTSQQISDMLKIKKSKIEHIAYKEKIRKNLFNELIDKTANWDYFCKIAIELDNRKISYEKMSKILNEDLHTNNLVPKEINLTKNGLRTILHYKLNLKNRKERSTPEELNYYKNFIVDILKMKKRLSKIELDNLVLKNINITRKFLEHIYLDLRRKHIIASSLQRPLQYRIVDWNNKNYFIEIINKNEFIWFTGNRITKADLIKELILETDHPLTFGQIVKKYREKFNLNITGRDLGIIVNNERMRYKKSGVIPKIDIIIKNLDGNMVFLYIIPNIITENKINDNIKNELLQNFELDIKDHLRGTIEGKKLDKCMKNIASKLWNCKTDYVLENNKRPDLIFENKIVDIKKTVYSYTIRDVGIKYGKYSKVIEIWYLNKNPAKLTSKDKNVVLKPISEILNSIEEPIKSDILEDYNYINSKCVV